MSVLKIGVATPPGMSAAYSYFAPAFALGFDREERFELQMFYGGEPGATARALCDQQCDVASLNTVVGLVGRSQRMPMVAIGSVARRTHRWFAVPPDSSIRSMKGLGRKRIACDFPHLRLLADAALLEDGVDPKTVNWVPWQGSDMNAEGISKALAAGEIDAVFIIDWNDGDLAARGIQLRHLSSTLLNRLRLSSCYWANEAAVQDKHDLIARGSRVLTRSLIYAMKYPERTIELMWERFPETRPKDNHREFSMRRDLAVLEARLAPMRIAPSDPSPMWGFMPESEFELLQECLLATGAMEAGTNISECFTTGFLAAFNDQGSEDHRNRAAC